MSTLQAILDELDLDHAHNLGIVTDRAEQANTA